MALDAVFDLSDIRRGFRGLGARANDAGSRDFLLELRPSARKDVKEHQHQRRGEGDTWPHRSSASRARARYASKPRRRRKSARTGLLGGLPRAWKVTTDASALRMRHRVVWARVHDEGGVVGRGARVPRRQFAYFSRPFQTSMRRQYGAYLRKGWVYGR